MPLSKIWNIKMTTSFPASEFEKFDSAKKRYIISLLFFTFSFMLQSKIKSTTLNWGEILKIFVDKWNLNGNNPTPTFIETSAFKTKLSWKPPKRDPCLEVYWSQVKQNFLDLPLHFWVIWTLQINNGQQ